MANYQYDESGVLASYFVLTFLSLILIPLTLSYLPSRQATTVKNVCNCSECEAKEDRLKRSKSRSIFKPRMGIKSVSTIAGWALFAFLCYKIATTELNDKPYDPFEILGLRHGTEEKDIKRHYKKLSLKFHPDKVKLAENQTMEEVEAHFVELTKAYKSLTDEEIRSNLEKFGHPDGKQEFSMGLALPTWVVASKNNFWVLGVYGVLFAGLLPMLVGRWWFGSRKMTKDGVLGATAQLFFKNVREDTTAETLIFLLARAWEIEQGSSFKSTASQDSLVKLEADIKAIVGDSYGKKPVKVLSSAGSVVTRRAWALLYAHLLRIKVQDPSLQQELEALLPATQVYLGSMLSMALAHNWLACTSNIMHLHSYIAQATFPGSNPLLAYPSVTKDEVKLVEGGVNGYIKALEEKHDPRAEMVQRIADKWGQLEVIDPQFKVIGERVVSPGAIVQLLFKLRLTPPTQTPTPAPELTPEQRKQEIRDEDTFLNSKEDTAQLTPGLQVPGYVHAPYYPANRKPSWWVMIGDQKMNRVIVPPIRVSDVPFGNSSLAPKDYRMYKLQFQAPPQVGVYTFQLAFVSDTFVGEDVRMFLPLKVEELSEEEQDQEDEISDPDEDTLAGQMAAMRGEKVKKSPYHGDASDDESSTDDDQSSGNSGSSDSDSDSDSD